MPFDLDTHEPNRAATGAGFTEMTPLPSLQAGGFGATVDAYAWEPETDTSTPRMRLWLISLLGSQQAVKALWAHLIKGETATLSTQGGRAQFCALSIQRPRAWRFFRASLPTSGGYHGMLVPEVALCIAERPEFVLLRRSADDPTTLHYRFMNRRVTLPLHPTWADWLWIRALRTGEARRVESWGLEAYRCSPDEAALTADLTAAIEHGALGLDDVRQPASTGLTTPPLGSR
ncbi:MAG: hypothetical protein IT305_00915 [Chloroflexi bacterium]|nr:hypothetical protein [Chloroflexota bacterium]